MTVIPVLTRRLARERLARLQAEAILEQKARELVGANEQLQRLNEGLESEIREKLAELRHSEQRYRGVIESVKDIIYKISPAGVFTFVSPSVEQLLGYTVAEVVGRHFTLFVQPARRAALADFYLDMLTTRQDSTYSEFPALTKDGREVWIGQTVRLVTGEGQPAELVAVARDISDRKQTEAALQTTQARLATLITSLQSAVLVEDEYRNVVLVNQLFCDLFAVSAPSGTLAGEDCRHSPRPAGHLFSDPDRFDQRVDELLLNRQPATGERLPTADGRMLERDYIPILVGTRYLGQLWRYTDVTERFLSREELRRSEEKYRGIMNNMELGLLEVDNNQMIVVAYERFCQMVGYSREELIGQNAQRLLLPDEYITTPSEHNGTRVIGQAGSYEVEMIKKDGSRIWVLISGVPISDENGIISGSMGIHYDITERKLLEQELAQAKHIAEEARQAETQFLANMSHEIRTPLNAIIGMSHLLFDTRPTAQQIEYIDILKTSADFLHSLISDLLDMTKIEAGRVEIHPRPFDLAGLLRATQRVFQMKLENRPIEIDVMLDARITGDFIGDDVMLNQILLNLVGNAEKFTEEGYIQLTARVKQQENDTYWIEFQITDTGTGMAADKLDIIFQKFRQVNAQGHKHRGTGLGLAITKELVELQNGTISVNSREGEGSVFTFVLPYVRSSAPAERADPADLMPGTDSPLGLCHLMVVEDNLMNQKYVGKLLDKWHIRYTLVSDGKKAVEEAKKQPFDLILMDIQMPIMDGYQAAVAIRSTHNPNQHVPIIALTASAMPDHRNIAMAVGMDDFLAKPFEPTQLYTLLQKYALPGTAENGTPAGEPVAQRATVRDRLDRAQLNTLYDGDRDYAIDMFTTFLDDVLPEFAVFATEVTGANWPVVGRLAHKLKPTLGMVGLTKLQDTLNEVVNMADRISAGQLTSEADVRQFCAAFSHELDRMIPFVRDELHRLSQE